VLCLKSRTYVSALTLNAFHYPYSTLNYRLSALISTEHCQNSLRAPTGNEFAVWRFFFRGIFFSAWSFPLVACISDLAVFTLSFSIPTDYRMVDIKTLVWYSLKHCSWKTNQGCVSIQGTHPSKGAFEGWLRHCNASRLSHFEGSFKCGQQMQPSFPDFEGYTGWILHGPRFIALWIFFTKWRQREQQITYSMTKQIK
jgi:hypothetical protein